MTGNTTVQGIMAGDGGCKFFFVNSRIRRKTDFWHSFGSDECVNVQEALDSCGGCASTGEGKDCTKIRGALGVGCAESRCLVFSCRPGWKVSMSGESCVRSKALPPPSHNSTQVETKEASRLRRLAREHARRQTRRKPSP